MTRSILQPIRTRRAVRTTTPVRPESANPPPALSPGTRRTLAAIGALWISFGVTASAEITVPTTATTGAIDTPPPEAAVELESLTQ